MIDYLQTDSYFERHTLDRLNYFSLEINLDTIFNLMAIDPIKYEKVVKSKHIKSTLDLIHFVYDQVQVLPMTFTKFRMFLY